MSLTSYVVSSRKEIKSQVLLGRESCSHNNVEALQSWFCWWINSPTHKLVTGANKGIGFEICKQLALNGVTVMLTSRDEERGLQAVTKLLTEEPGLSDLVVFHQLDVADPASADSLADFVKSQFGKLDILVNNAGIGGYIMDGDAMRKAVSNGWPKRQDVDWNAAMVQTYELAEKCLQINYYGAKTMVESLLPFLQLSDSPRIVNVASSMGKLKHIPNKRVKEVLNNIEDLTETKIDELLKEFLQDFKEGLLETKGWPKHIPAYVVSKASLIAYTRMLAIKYPKSFISSVCPGFVITDITCNTGHLTAAEGAANPVKLALSPEQGCSGKFFSGMEVTGFED